MSEQRVLKVQQGLWVDEQWLRDAGLGPQLQVIVRPGEIRILSAPPQAESAMPSAKGWEIFRSMGQEAQAGQLPNAAVDHDLYLYGKSHAADIR